MDIGLAFSYVFEDDDWLKKVGIAALVLLIPIIGQLIVLGWALTITRRVIQNDPVPLPDWNDFGEYTIFGLKAFVIGLVYAIPLIIFMIPSSILSGTMDPHSPRAIISIIVTLLGCLTFLYSLLIALIMPAAYGQLAATGEIGEGLNVSKIISMITKNPSTYLMAFLGLILAGIVASLGSIACGIGVIATSAYAMAVEGHLFGQAYRVANPAGPESPAA
jgi:hypothetical protein